MSVHTSWPKHYTRRGIKKVPFLYSEAKIYEAKTQLLVRSTTESLSVATSQTCLALDYSTAVAAFTGDNSKTQQSTDSRAGNKLGKFNAASTYAPGSQ